MSIHRTAAKRDANEPIIRKRFSAHGWHTEQVSGTGLPDLLCWPQEYGAPLTWPRQSCLLVDVKIPKGTLKPAQVKKWTTLHALGIPVYVVRTEADVDALVGGTLAQWEPPERGRARPGLVTPRGGPRKGDAAKREPSSGKAEKALGAARKRVQGHVRASEIASRAEAIVDGRFEPLRNYTPPRSTPVGRRCSKGCGNHGWDTTNERTWRCSDCGMPPEATPVGAAKEAEVFAAPRCHAASDGECSWAQCPQEANNRANYKSWCPLAAKHDDDDA